MYIDDLIITSTKEVEVEAFKIQMKATIQMSDLGLLCFYLGIKVHQDDDDITFRQPLMGISLCTWSLWEWFFSASWTAFRAARTATS
jgi:hypothetical protein